MFHQIPHFRFGKTPRLAPVARYLCKAGVDSATADKVLAALKSAGVVDANDIVDLEVG